MTASGLRSILRNSAYLAGARAVNILVRAVYVVVLAHALGPELYGLFSYGTSWYLAFMPLATLGLDMLVSRELGCGTDDAASVVMTTFLLRVAAAVLVAGLSALLAWSLEPDLSARTLLSLFAIALIGRSLANWSDDIFTARETTSDSLWLHSALRPLEVAVGMTVLLAGGSVIALAWVHTLVWWTHALIAWRSVRRQLPDTPARLLPGRSILAMIAAGIPLALVASLQAWLLNGPLVLFRLTGGDATDLGQLSLAIQVLMVAIGLGMAVPKASLPILSRAVVRGDTKDRLFAEETLRLCAWGGLAAWLATEAWGNEVLVLLFGERYASSGVLAAPMMALLYPLLGGSILVHVLIARGESWGLVWLALVGAATMSGLQPLLALSSLQLTGVVLAMGAGYLAWMTGLILLLKNRAGLRLGRALGAPWLLIGIVVVSYQCLAPVSRPLAFSAALLVLALAALKARQDMLAQMDVLRT